MSCFYYLISCCYSIKVNEPRKDGLDVSRHNNSSEYDI
jgi:hypothetical protein